MFRVVYVSCVRACVSLVLRTVIDCFVKCSYKKTKTKNGIKLWCRCGSTNGYLCQFEVYIGKESETQATLLPSQAQGSITAVVCCLTRLLVGKDFFAFMDNFFCDISLFRELLNENIYCCGTQQKN